MNKKKTNHSKKVRVCALVLALVFTLAACGGGGTQAGETGSDITPVAMGQFADYAFVPSYILLTDIDSHIHGSFAHEGRIYFYYTERYQFPDDFDWGSVDWNTWQDPPSSILVASVLPDGSDLQEVRIQMQTGSPEMRELHITEAGNFRAVVIEREWDTMRGETVDVFLAEFDRAGNEISLQQLNVTPPGSGGISIDRVEITTDGYVLLTAWLDRGDALFVVAPTGNIVAEVDVEWARAITSTQDGRAFAFAGSMVGDSWVEQLHEIDLATGALGATIPLALGSVRNIHTAPEHMPFDLLIETGMHLFGLNLETGEIEQVLNWIDAGVALEWGTPIAFFEDGRISVLVSDWVQVDGMHQMRTELIVLTQTERSLLPVRETITLGGVGFFGDINQRVVAFNRESNTHRITIVDYDLYNTNEDWSAGHTRLLTELSIGQGPDILWGHGLESAIDRGFLVDLYAFMDSDPVISRTDFFQSVLSSMESSDGALRAVSETFSISTMVGLTSDVGHIDNWTFAEMQNLIEQANAAGMTHPLGTWMTGLQFLVSALQFSGEQFFDWEAGTADLNNEAFIDLLEAAGRLPREVDDSGRDTGIWVSDFERILNGDQMILNHWMSGVQGIQELSGALQDFTVLGLPTPEGGGHVIQTNSIIGINANSEHQEAAWGFIREALLPGADIETWNFPLRIDAFEELLANAMIQEYWTDEHGVEHPISHGGIGWGDFMINLYAVSQAEADLLREIIETANLSARFDNTISDMLMEELLPFFAGDRSAADTARILDNRVGIYLSERR